jgi:hypothetical protein
VIDYQNDDSVRWWMPEFVASTTDIVPMGITAFTAASIQNTPMVLGPTVFLGTYHEAVRFWRGYRSCFAMEGQ